MLTPSCPPCPGFYGPSVTSISSLIAPALDEYVKLVEFDFEDKPYVFCTRDATRCQTSSQWSAYCKAIFKKWSGVACPPKMLVRVLAARSIPRAVAIALRQAGSRLAVPAHSAPPL